jgi:hypothetical protein
MILQIVFFMVMGFRMNDFAMLGKDMSLPRFCFQCLILQEIAFLKYVMLFSSKLQNNLHLLNPILHEVPKCEMY